MLTEDEVLAVSKKVEQEEVPLAQPQETRARIPAPPSALESFAVGAMKSNPIYNLTKYVTEDHTIYMPDDTDLTKVEGLLDGVPEHLHWKVLSQVSEASAQRLATQLREMDEMNRLQYANGSLVGIAGEIAGYLDPLTTAVGGKFLQGAFAFGKMARLSPRLTGAVSLGALGSMEQEATWLGHAEANDEEDILYTFLVSAGAGAALGKIMSRGFGDEAAEHLDEVIAHTDDSIKQITHVVRNDMDTVLAQKVGIHEPDVVEAGIPRIEPGAGARPVQEIKGAGVAKADVETFTPEVIDVGDITRPRKPLDPIDVETVPLHESSVKGSVVDDLSKDIPSPTKEKIVDENIAPEHTATNMSQREAEISAASEELVKSNNILSIPKKMITKLLEKNPLMTDGFRLLMSKSPTAKAIASHIGELAIGQRKGISRTAATYKEVQQRLYLKMIPVIEDAKVKYLSSIGIKKWNPFKYHGEGARRFDMAIQEEMARRHMGIIEEVNEHIARAASAIDDSMKRITRDLKEAGWEGADDIQWKSGYMPLRWSSAKIMKIVHSGKRPQLQRLLAKAYGNVGMSEELSERLANAIIRRKLEGAADLDFNPSTLFSKSGRGALEQMLRESGVSELDIRGIMKVTEKQTRGVHTRTDIDLTTQSEGLAVFDIMETDVGNILSRFAQEQAGKYGLAKKGIKSFDDIDAYRNVVRRESADLGEDAVNIGAATDAIFDSLLARPVNGGVSRNVRRMLEWTMVSKLGQVGFAQVAEMNNTFAAHGFISTMKTVPKAIKMYKLLLKAAKSGEFTKEELGFLGEMQALGGQMFDEHLLLRPGVRLDETLDAGWKGVMDNISAMASDKLGYLSGMYQIKGMEQTLVMILQSNKVAKVLKGKMTKKALSRLSDLGWDEKVVAGIKKNIDAHAVFSKGALDRLNLEQWDEAARLDFIHGMHRHVNQQIQLGFAGEGSFRLHSDVGALFTQFRRFPLLALEKQTGRHLMNGDPEAGLAFLYGAGWASVASLAKTYSNTVGMSKERKKKYLKQRLSPQAVGAQALNYGSSFSILGDIAGAGGSLLGWTDRAARGGGLTPPVWSAIQQEWKGMSNLIGAANPTSDIKLTPSGVRNAFSLLPFNNTLPGTVIINNLQKFGE